MTAVDVSTDVVVLFGSDNQEQAAALDVGAVFVDPVAEQWIPGPDSPLFGQDGEHPSSQGQQFLEGKIKGLPTMLEGAGNTVPALPNSRPN